MRGGKFLAEESPDNLLQQYSCETLEDVFLKLSVIQNKGKRRRSSIVQEISDQVSVPAITVSKAGLSCNSQYTHNPSHTTRTQLWISVTKIWVRYPVNLVTASQ